MTPVALFSSVWLLSTVAAAAKDQECELHIWPTQSFGAIFFGGTAAYNGGYGPVVSLYQNQLDAAKATLAKSIPGPDQVSAIQSMNLGLDGKFKGYRLIFHPAPTVSRYANWIAKDVGAGPRDAESASRCYAELHVVFVTLFRTAMSKKIQTGFVFREFGDALTTAHSMSGAGSTGAALYKTDDASPPPAALDDLHAAFRENLAIFLRSKQMRAKIPNQ